MKGRNWKTSGVGIAVMAAAVVLALLPKEVSERFKSTSSDIVILATGLGLIAAKDGDK